MQPHALCFRPDLLVVLRKMKKTPAGTHRLPVSQSKVITLDRHHLQSGVFLSIYKFHANGRDTKNGISRLSQPTCQASSSELTQADQGGRTVSATTVPAAAETVRLALVCTHETPFCFVLVLKNPQENPAVKSHSTLESYLLSNTVMFECLIYHLFPKGTKNTDAS